MLLFTQIENCILYLLCFHDYGVGSLLVAFLGQSDDPCGVSPYSGDGHTAREFQKITPVGGECDVGADFHVIPQPRGLTAPDKFAGTGKLQRFTGEISAKS